MGAALALAENRIPEAEGALREHLKRHPTDVAAIRMLAEVAARLGRYVDAENLLARCLELAPGFSAARHNYAMVLHRQNKPEAALARGGAVARRRPAQSRLSQSQGRDPRRASANTRRPSTQYRSGARRVSEAAEGVDEHGPRAQDRRPQRREHRRLPARIALAPHLGEAYWSLANLKTFRFTRRGNRRPCASSSRAPILRTTIGFTSSSRWARRSRTPASTHESFAHYAEGNRPAPRR